MNNRQHPIAGVYYPRTYQEFLDWFADETACRRYLARCRWPDDLNALNVAAAPSHGQPQGISSLSAMRKRGPCNGRNHLRRHTDAAEYVVCRYLVRDQQEGQRECFGAETYSWSGELPTVRAWLHKLRSGMVHPDREQVRGRIEADETYIGGCDIWGEQGCGRTRRQIVVVSVEVLTPKSFGRVRVRKVPDVSGNSFVPLVNEAAEKGLRNSYQWMGRL